MENMLTHLLEMLFPPRGDELVVRSVQDVHGLVSPCALDTRAPQSVGLLPFQHPSVRALIHEAKYHKNTRALRILGEVLGEYLSAYREDNELSRTPCIIVPVPLAAPRRRERDYNQVEEILRHTPLPQPMAINHNILKKIKDSKSQTTLTRSERLKNQEGAFVASPCSPHTHYVIIDDVVTTGATLSAAHNALRVTGARSVATLALAY